MEERSQTIQTFFEEYERHFNDSLNDQIADIEEIMSESFAECFVESSPVGVMCGKNDDNFIRNILKGIEFYKSIGSKSMHITDTQIESLDNYHDMVKVQWQYAYEKNQNTGTIDFQVIYFLRTVEDEMKIFAYIAGDEQKALQERGLVAGQ